MDIGLPQLPGKLQEHLRSKYGVETSAPKYRACFNGAVEKHFPAKFTGGRWKVDEADLDKAAVALGLISPEQVAQKRPQRPAKRRPAAAAAREPVAA